ncbi:hypothetical protein [Kangiella sp. HZ709]|uniref:hypothetical protein n=1 Tax=Kangiella sp. HZ709 TaxID=2666328 RepID=UPI0012B14EFF|nr:hypothetical protein [Kangiella sp. HZ709]MRX26808.1 hypothetical protein [Kangiella sp. HZ709]
MKLFNKTIAAVLTAAALGISVNAKAASCANPVEKLTRVLDCIDVENAFCAARGYAWNFKKFHNGVDTKTNNFLLSPIGWLTTFNFIGFEFDIQHLEQIDEDTVDIHYYEYVRFPDGEIITQYEEAEVTFNRSCRMTLWDQEGDQAEQDAVDEKTKELFPFF